jgi:hypothetical protein
LRFRKRTAQHGKVLRKDGYTSPAHGAYAGDHTIPGVPVFIQPKIAAAMRDEGVGFVKGAGVEEVGQALTSSQLAFGMLRFDAVGSATLHGSGSPAFQFGRWHRKSPFGVNIGALVGARPANHG